MRFIIWERVKELLFWRWLQRLKRLQERYIVILIFFFRFYKKKLKKKIVHFYKVLFFVLQEIPLIIAERRPGDAEVVYASTAKAERELNWK